MPTSQRIIKPQPGPQTAFLSTPADICIYGGAAGGGKTWGLLFEPLRHVNNKDFGAVIFRRTYPQITLEGGMWDESGDLYPLMGAKPNRSELYWTFDSGARVKFAHMNRESVKHDYQGAQIAMIGYDQLEHFSESAFFYMLSRNRSMCGVRPYIRATCNPDADSWIANLISWWINQNTGYPIRERSGVIRYFLRINDKLIWADTAEELRARYPDPKYIPKSLTFIPAVVYDNKILLKNDPDYLANLIALPFVDMERLLMGNWKIRLEAGKVFNRDWFPLVDSVPDGGIMCRFWDFAATAKKTRKFDPDYTAGVRERLIKGAFYVEDCIAEQINPSEVDDLFMATTMQDVEYAKAVGARYLVRWEIEPGSASLRESARLIKLLHGIDAAGVPAKGEKLLRAKPFAAQAKGGNVYVLRADWTEGWLTHMHNQPEIMHDDIMDASVGSHDALCVAEKDGAGSREKSGDAPAAGGARYSRGVSAPSDRPAARTKRSLRGTL